MKKKESDTLKAMLEEEKRRIQRHLVAVAPAVPQARRVLDSGGGVGGDPALPEHRGQQPLLAGMQLALRGEQALAEHVRGLIDAAEPLTDKITWQNGNEYTFRLRSSTYMQVAMLVPHALEMKKKRWALVYPNFEYGQSAATWFKQMMKAKQPDIEFVSEQTPPLGKVDAGASRCISQFFFEAEVWFAFLDDLASGGWRCRSRWHLHPFFSPLC